MVEKNKVLVVGLKHSGKLRLINQLFKSLPEDLKPGQSHSGLIHRVKLTTKYYTKSIDLWVDEFEQDSVLGGLHEWCEEFKQNEFKEIRDVISGVIFCVDLKTIILDEVDELTEELIELVRILKQDQIGNFPENEEDGFEIWNGFLMTVGVGDLNTDKSAVSSLKETFWDKNLDFVLYIEGEEIDESSRDEYGDQLGVAKAKGIIETFDWENIELDPGKIQAQPKPQNVKIAEELKEPLLDKKFELDYLILKVKQAKLHTSQIKSQDDKQKFADEFMKEIENLI